MLEDFRTGSRAVCTVTGRCGAESGAVRHSQGFWYPTMGRCVLAVLGHSRASQTSVGFVFVCISSSRRLLPIILISEARSASRTKQEEDREESTRTLKNTNIEKKVL
jgi:hypothetical protein